jgi:hypothetical protein
VYQRNWASGDALGTPQGLWVAVAEVVEHKQIETCRQQLDAGVGSDIAGTAGHQYFRRHFVASIHYR